MILADANLLVYEPPHLPEGGVDAEGLGSGGGLALRAVRVDPLPEARHQGILGSLLRATGSRSSLVPDAHIAALAVEHGLALCTTDGDSARFPGPRWENPLAG